MSEDQIGNAALPRSDLALRGELPLASFPSPQDNLQGEFWIALEGLLCRRQEQGIRKSSWSKRQLEDGESSATSNGRWRRYWRNRLKRQKPTLLPTSTEHCRCGDRVGRRPAYRGLISQTARRSFPSMPGLHARGSQYDRVLGRVMMSILIGRRAGVPVAFLPDSPSQFRASRRGTAGQLGDGRCGSPLPAVRTESPGIRTPRQLGACVPRSPSPAGMRWRGVQSATARPRSQKWVMC